MTVKTKIIKIGNSQGVRIPKTLLQQARLGEEVELEIQEGKLLIKPANSPRAGWETAFERAAQAGSDGLLLPEFENEWDETDWEW